jgi:hypothetical protein
MFLWPARRCLMSCLALEPFKLRRLATPSAMATAAPMKASTAMKASAAGAETTDGARAEPAHGRRHREGPSAHGRGAERHVRTGRTEATHLAGHGEAPAGDSRSMEGRIGTGGAKRLIRDSVGTEVAIAKPARSKGMDAPIKTTEM